MGEEITIYQTDCIYSWPVRYLRDKNTYTVRIRLLPDHNIDLEELEMLKIYWEFDMISKWMGFTCPVTGDSFNLRIRWVDHDEHYTVPVVPGPHRSNMLEWDDQDTGGVIAHELGHMLGLRDEYEFDNIPTCQARSPVNTGTVMEHPSYPVIQRLVNRICQPLPSEPPYQLLEYRSSPMKSKPTFLALEMQISLSIFGGNPGNRLATDIVIDELSQTIKVTQNDQLFGILSESSERSVSPEFFSQLREYLSERELDTDLIRNIPPGSLVAVLTVKSNDETHSIIYPIEELNLPMEPGEGLTISRLKPSKTSPLIHQLHSLVTGIAEQKRHPSAATISDESMINRLYKVLNAIETALLIVGNRM